MSGLRFRRILVPVDFSPPSQRAVDVASGLARSAGGPASLVLVHAFFVPPEIETLAVIEHAPLLEAMRARGADELEKILVQLQDRGVAAEYEAVNGPAEQVIVELARDRQVDLIVMGTHGRTGLKHVLLGSVAERVIRHAPCPVLTVKA